MESPWVRFKIVHMEKWRRMIIKESGFLRKERLYQKRVKKLMLIYYFLKLPLDLGDNTRCSN